MAKKIFERFSKRGTNYFIQIEKLSDEQKEEMRAGANYEVTLGVGRNGRTYFLNRGGYTSSYVAEKFGKYGNEVTGDIKSLTEKLNEYFEFNGEKKELLENLEPIETEIIGEN